MTGGGFEGGLAMEERCAGFFSAFGNPASYASFVNPRSPPFARRLVRYSLRCSIVVW